MKRGRYLQRPEDHVVAICIYCQGSIYESQVRNGLIRETPAGYVHQHCVSRWRASQEQSKDRGR